VYIYFVYTNIIYIFTPWEGITTILKLKIMKTFIIVDRLGGRHATIKSDSRESAQNTYIGGFVGLIGGVFAMTVNQYELIKNN
jgi:hypothetical protein